MKTIDLAEKRDIYPEPASIGGSSEPYYPSIYLEGKEEGVDIPDEGYALVKYKVVSKTTSESDGKKRHSCSIEFHEFTPKKGKGKANTEKEEGDDSSDDDAVEAGLKDAEKRKSK